MGTGGGSSSHGAFRGAASVTCTLPLTDWRSVSPFASRSAESARSTNRTPEVPATGGVSTRPQSVMPVSSPSESRCIAPGTACAMSSGGSASHVAILAPPRAASPTSAATVAASGRRVTILARDAHP